MLEFAKGAIREQEWVGIFKLLDHYDIQNVIEFGSGMSTKCFYESNLDVVSFETNAYWKHKVEKECSAKIILWDNQNFPVEYLDSHFDLAFVDGKAPRHNQTRVARIVSDKILFHDGRRKQETEMILELMQDWKEVFHRDMLKGGLRLFVR